MAGESENLEVDGSLIGKDDDKDIMAIHGACTRGNDAGLNDNVGLDGSIRENKDESPASGGFEDSQGVRSLGGKSENEITELDGNDATLKAFNEQKDVSHKGVKEILEKEVISDVIPVESDVRNARTPEKIGSHKEQEIGDGELGDVEQSKTTVGKVIKHASMKSSGKSYQLPREKEGRFSVYDIVLGKVRSHPWWPGQIFDPSDSSAQAMKHFKKDSYLVAYYGDGTFAWNEASKLKSFRTHFSCIEKQSKSEAFRNAVDCALDEVKRRVEFGLACSCIPKNTFDKIKLQNFKNCGIREELSFEHRVDESSSVSSFFPEKLVEYVKALSKMPTSGFDQLELLTAKAQLLAFYRLKGLSSLPELQYCGGIETDNLINDTDRKMSEVDEHTIHASINADQTATGSLKTANGSRRKRKRNLKDGLYLEKKESLAEPTDGTPDSNLGDCEDDEVIGNLIFPVLSKKRKKVDHPADVSGTKGGRRTVSRTKVPTTTKQSFRIGECILRVANQLTSPPSTLRCSGDRSQMEDRKADDFSGNGFDVFSNVEETHKSNLVFPAEFSSLHDLLFLLQWVAREPRGDYSFLNVIASFFSDFRNSIILSNDSGKEILPADETSSPKAFEFDDLSETYCKDVVMENGSEEQLHQRSSRLDHQHVPSEPEKPVHVYTRRSCSRKQSFDSNHDAEVPEKPSGYLDEKSPAELVLDFAELDSVPSETSLNNIFRHFGPLEESETEIDRGSSRARVVFKKCADAEAAFSSAKKLNIFRPILVNYQLNYSPSSLFEASSLATTQDQEMHIDLPDVELNMV